LTAPTPYSIAENATSASSWQVGLSGPIIVNNTGSLVLYNATQTANVSLTALNLSLSGTTSQIILNSAATESGASWRTLIGSAISGQTADVTFNLPANGGSSGQVLQTDGSGNTSWVSAASTATTIQTITHTVLYSDTSPYAYFTLPINAVIEQINVNVTTAFNGISPSLSVGVTGTTSKWMTALQNNLGTVGGYTTDLCRFVATSGSTQAIIITFSPGGAATAGAANVQLWYSVPSAV